jgi:hypothetical protein
MKETYGEVILKKGSILYHTSDEKFTYKDEDDKPLLFCTFHPSEWYYGEEYITFISLKKDISLFFMIDFNDNSSPFSCLPKITNNNIHLLKMTHTNSQLLYYSHELKNNNFDGWFNSNAINKVFIEVGLINDKNIFEILKTEKIKKDWCNHNNANNIVTRKNWGLKYKISSIEIPVIFRLHKRYEEHIKKYLEKSINNKFYLKYVFQILLINSELNYHDGNVKYIYWNITNF